MVVLVCAIHYQLAKISNFFAREFEDFDADVPWLWDFLLHNALFYWIIPLFIACFILSHQLGYLRRRAAALVAVLGTVGSLAICTFGLYLPVLRLAGWLEEGIRN